MIIHIFVHFVILIFAAARNFCECTAYNDEFDEKLIIKPLPSGHVYTHFQFVIQKDVESVVSSKFQHFRLFPRSLGEILSKHNVQELHFSLSQGLWRYEKWGYPARSSTPGAELWAVFTGNIADVTSNWQKLANILSGQFCASLNFIDNTNTVIPKLSFRPEGAISSDHPFNSSFIRYAALPPEIVCTENLTPFRKLLPCGAMAGLSTLLNALNLFNAHFVSLAVDAQIVCKDSCSSAALQLTQSVSVVFDPPVQQGGKQDWSFVKLFGSLLTSTCPLASTSKVYVSISSNKTGTPFTLNLNPSEIIQDKPELDDELESIVETYAVYDLKELFKETRSVNIGATYKGVHVYGIYLPPVLYADRKVSGYGQEHGGIHCVFYNNHPKKSIKILYFDVIPWYLRLYSHTLVIKSSDKIIKPEYFYYQPAQDRKRPHHLEIVLTLFPKSTTELRIDFDFAFLKWTEYPPDANHGFYVGSAVVSTLLDASRNFTKFPDHRRNKMDKGNFLRLHTQILLVSLPTPDFSMPYNVICLTCTVVALAFGPIHNITTKSLYPLEEEEKETFFAKIKKRVRSLFKSKDSKQSETKSEEVKEAEVES